MTCMTHENKPNLIHWLCFVLIGLNDHAQADMPYYIFDESSHAAIDLLRKVSHRFSKNLPNCVSKFLSPCVKNILSPLYKISLVNRLKFVLR